MALLEALGVLFLIVVIIVICCAVGCVIACVYYKTEMESMLSKHEMFDTFIDKKKMAKLNKQIVKEVHDIEANNNRKHNKQRPAVLPPNKPGKGVHQKGPPAPPPPVAPLKNKPKDHNRKREKPKDKYKGPTIVDIDQKPGAPHVKSLEALKQGTKFGPQEDAQYGQSYAAKRTGTDEFVPGVGPLKSTIPSPSNN